MTATQLHRLDGLEPDNFLAFLALLGAMRALDVADVAARVSWTVEAPPVRPQLLLQRELRQEEVAGLIATGIERLAAKHSFDGHADLDYSRDECRRILSEAAVASSSADRRRADLLAALMCDAAVKEGKEQLVDPTPLCLLFGQGHQHFLERLAAVPNTLVPPARGRARSGDTASASESIARAVFRPWTRVDPTPSFRWDPQEDVRYATLAGDPTDPAFKSGTEHGANRLAAIGLVVLTVCAEQRFARVRAKIVGGVRDVSGLSFAWPIWREPSSLAGVAALLSHPDLRRPGALRYLGVDHVMVASRISVGKFMNIARARALI